MIYYIHDHRTGPPIVTPNLRWHELWMMEWLKVGGTITITRPGPQPWHNKTWRHKPNHYENHNHNLP